MSPTMKETLRLSVMNYAPFLMEVLSRPGCVMDGCQKKATAAGVQVGLTLSYFYPPPVNLIYDFFQIKSKCLSCPRSFMSYDPLVCLLIILVWAIFVNVREFNIPLLIKVHVG